MILGFLELLVTNAAVLFAAHLLMRKAGGADGAVDALLFQLFRILLITAVVIVAGLTKTLTPHLLGGAGVVVLVVLLACGAHKTLTRPARPDMGRATMALLVLIGVRMLAQVWFFAPYSPDALSYHLPKVAEWVRAGAFTREMGLDLNATLPAGFELIEAWWTVFLHHDVLIEMAGVEFAVLAFLAVRVLALQLGLEPGSAFLAGTLYLVTPLFALQATSCLNDAPVAALVLSLAALAAAHAHPALALIPVGLLAGVKPTGCFTVPAWILLWVLRRDRPRLQPASTAWAAGAAVVALAAGAFWYARNLAWYGHPLYPVGVRVPIFGEILVQTSPRLGSLGENLSALMNGRIADRAGGVSTLSLETAGWGALAFGLGGVALIAEARRDPGFRRVAAAFGLALLLVLLMVRPDPWNARFTLFFPAILGIAAAKLAETLKPAAVLVAAGAALAFLTGILPADQPAAVMRALAGQPWRERNAGPYYEGTPPPGNAVAVLARARIPTYYLYGADYSRRVVYLRAEAAADVLQGLEGVRLLFADKSSRQPLHLDDLVVSGRLRPIGGAYYTLP